MNEFVKYTQKGFDFENAENTLFEMVARCLAFGNRIIIELSDEPGEEYIMVDFMPTDGTCNRGGYEYDGHHVCYLSSVWHDDEGNYDGEFTSYFDAIKEVAKILRSTYFSQIYVESY